MYDYKYVRKRKTRIFVAIGAGISTIVVATLCIVSFLGKFVGTFTVRLETGVVSLTLCEKSDFQEPTSFLRVYALQPFQECEYATLINRVGDEVLDSEDSSYLLGAHYDPRDGTTLQSFNFLKYTFFVKNVGNIPVTYSLQVNIIDSKSDNGKLVDDTLRVMVYDNYIYEETHNATVYAKESITSHHDEEGNVSYREKISTDEYGYAEPFQSTSIITTLHEEFFDVGDVKRYTLVMWLEGWDPESNRKYDPPKNARIKLGVEINAYEI